MRSTPTVGPVGLQCVDVDHRDQIPQPVVGGAHRRLPRRAFVEFAVGQEVDDPRAGSLESQPERHPDRDGEAMAQ